eukprot:3185607-Alexandrium_andersonii.AAC.1
MALDGPRARRGVSEGRDFSSVASDTQQDGLESVSEFVGHGREQASCWQLTDCMDSRGAGERRRGERAGGGREPAACRRPAAARGCQGLGGQGGVLYSVGQRTSCASVTGGRRVPSQPGGEAAGGGRAPAARQRRAACLLYTSDAADDM